MEQKIIDKAIYEKYIAPTKTKTKKFIGIEIEMPIVNLNKKPVDENVVFEMAREFCRHFGFKVIGRDADNNANSMMDELTGDDLSFDCCYSNLELSESGLKQRGMGEEIFLKPLFERAYSLSNPAKIMLEGLGHGVSIEHYIKQYSML